MNFNYDFSDSSNFYDDIDYYGYFEDDNYSINDYDFMDNTSDSSCSSSSEESEVDTEFEECLQMRLQNIKEDEAGKSISLNSFMDDFYDMLDINDIVIDLAEALRYNTTIVELHLDSCGLVLEHAIEFSRALRNMSALKWINLNSNRIGDEGLGSIVKSLENNSNINVSNISVSDNNIGGKGVQYVANFLLQYEMYSLILKNLIGEEGTDHYKGYLNNSLKTFDISSNNIGDEGAIIFAKALAYNPPLENLYLHDTKITSVGIKTITTSLMNNQTLCYLDLSGNEIRGEAVRLFTELLAYNTHVHSIILRRINIVDEVKQTLLNDKRFHFD